MKMSIPVSVPKDPSACLPVGLTEEIQGPDQARGPARELRSGSESVREQARASADLLSEMCSLLPM